MAIGFTVLGSGSSGNASLFEVDGFGLLIDAGLGPRSLGRRLATLGGGWEQVHAAILTHTHSDHWRERTLTWFRRAGIPLFCHSRHGGDIGRFSRAFADLEAAGAVRRYQSHHPFFIAERIRCRPLPVRHDSAATFGFRFEVMDPSGALCCSLGYAADLGSWDTELAEFLADVDLLALEFNHDVHLERTSGRSAALVRRVCGDDGHLSNDQAAGLLREIIRRSRLVPLRHLVQLHLSRDCNRPSLAIDAARRTLGDATTIHTSDQHRPTCPILIETNGFAFSRAPAVRQLLLPCMEEVGDEW
jgi:phosphoribosyl 1,2-cyclic phosphodiesterase